MEKVADYILPLFCGALFLLSFFLDGDVGKSFSEGVKDGLKTVISIAPTMIFIITAINLFRVSGCMDLLVFILRPVTDYVGFPAEVLPLAVIKPLSGSGAMAFLGKILKEYGADSKIGLIASVLCASTETTFYTVSVYLSPLTGKTGKIFFCAAVADIVTVILSYVTVSLLCQ